MKTSCPNRVVNILLKDAQKCVIGINSAHPKTRQRFSIAHEIGHLVLHDKKELFIDKVVRVNFRDAKSSMAIDHNEIEANQFAAELLMPRELVRQQILSKNNIHRNKIL